MRDSDVVRGAKKKTKEEKSTLIFASFKKSKSRKMSSELFFHLAISYQKENEYIK